MSETKSEQSEVPAKKLNDDFNFQQMKDAKSECLRCFMLLDISFNGCLLAAKQFWSEFISPSMCFQSHQ